MNNTQHVLVLNAGSSSVKYRLYSAHDAVVIAEGLYERIGIDGQFKTEAFLPQHKTTKAAINLPDHKSALIHLFDFLIANQIIVDRSSITGVGHRIVQGGNVFSDSCVIDAQVLAQIKAFIPLAPLHNGPQAQLVEDVVQLLPNAINVAVFDTSFHQTMKSEHKTYAIDHQVAGELGIQRYGFHGTSYKFITQKMRHILHQDSVNLIVCHLGNGASMAAIANNHSLNTSMGLTPLQGLVMGTRSGDVDPGLVAYLANQKQWDVNQIDHFLNKQSGLLGLGGSSDMRDLIAKVQNNDPQAELAFNVFTTRVANYIVQYANDLENKLDAIVFTAGIGENSAPTREVICAKVHLLPIRINPEANASKIGEFALISHADSLPVYVVRTNEELMIFEDVKRFMTSAK